MREQASKDSEELDLIPKKHWRCENPTPPWNHRDLNQSRISTKVPAIFQKQQELKEYGKPEKVRIVKQDLLEIDNTLPKLDRVSEPKIWRHFLRHLFKHVCITITLFMYTTRHKIGKPIIWKSYLWDQAKKSKGENMRKKTVYPCLRERRPSFNNNFIIYQL